jgi:hypothetical protein
MDTEAVGDMRGYSKIGRRYVSVEDVEGMGGCRRAGRRGVERVKISASRSAMFKSM